MVNHFDFGLKLFLGKNKGVLYDKKHCTKRQCFLSHIILVRPCTWGFGLSVRIVTLWQIFKPSSVDKQRHPASTPNKRQEQQTRHQIQVSKESFQVSAYQLDDARVHVCFMILTISQMPAPVSKLLLDYIHTTLRTQNSQQTQRIIQHTIVDWL